MDYGQAKYLHKETRAGAPAQQRKKIGEILVERGLMTHVTVDRFVALAQRTGKRFGVVLEELGILTGDELAEALALQYNLRIVKDFAQYRYADSLLKMMTVETVIEHCMFPLKAENNLLAVAIADPTNAKVASNLAANAGMRLIPFVSTRREINRAITRHYLKRELVEDGRKKVLLIEDDHFTRAEMRRSLEKTGYAVFEAMDCMEAFKSVVSVKPEIVVIDQEMPKLNAYMFLGSIRNFPEMARTPVILISSAASTEEEATALGKGFFDFIPKPVKETTLLVKVHRALVGSSLI
jgi:PleD family two-component response regulator